MTILNVQIYRVQTSISLTTQSGYRKAYQHHTQQCSQANELVRLAKTILSSAVRLMRSLHTSYSTVQSGYRKAYQHHTLH